MSKLAIFDVDAASLDGALRHLQLLDQSHDSRVVVRKVDVTNEDGVDATVDEIARGFGGVDILLCFAGISGSRLAVEYPIGEWKRIFDVNINGTFLTARSVARFVAPCLDSDTLPPPPSPPLSLSESWTEAS